MFFWAKVRRATFRGWDRKRSQFSLQAGIVSRCYQKMAKRFCVQNGYVNHIGSVQLPFSVFFTVCRRRRRRREKMGTDGKKESGLK